MYACLAVTCHLHFWQNDRDFLRATVVTRGWNGYRNKSQHRKSTLEKKILPPFQQGFEPATFQSRVRCSNHWAIPAPHSLPAVYCHIWVESWSQILPCNCDVLKLCCFNREQFVHVFFLYVLIVYLFLLFSPPPPPLFFFSFLFSFFFFFLSHLQHFFPYWSFGLSYQGMATAALRTALPSHNSVCNVVVSLVFSL